MSSFVVPHADGSGALEFFERTPPDPARPIERFKVRLTLPELSAVVRVYAGDPSHHPGPLLAFMSQNWRGWEGTTAWESEEGELSLACTQDRAGHVDVRVVLRSGPGENDWSVRARVATEAGQLERLAQEAAAFFG